MESVLQNINKLNRSLEGVIAVCFELFIEYGWLMGWQVGNEFGAVEALWSQFENVMAKEEGDGAGEENGEGDEEDDGGEDGEDGQEGEEETIVEERRR